MYNNPVNSTDPTGHKECNPQDGCEGPSQPSKPPKSSTNTNQPGGNNTPANQATSTDDNNGNAGGNGSSPEGSGPEPYETEEFGVQILCGGSARSCMSRDFKSGSLNVVRIWITQRSTKLGAWGHVEVGNYRVMKHLLVDVSLLGTYAGQSAADMKSLNEFFGQYLALDNVNRQSPGLAAPVFVGLVTAGAQTLADGKLDRKEVFVSTVSGAATYLFEAAQVLSQRLEIQQDMIRIFNSIPGPVQIMPANVEDMYTPWYPGM